MFRAQRTNGKGEVEGWLFVRNSTDEPICFILEDSWTNIDCANKPIWEFGEVKVIPSTISMQTGQTDKNGKDIYGSIEINNVMTKGGDRVKTDDGLYLGNVIFSKRWTGFIIENELDNNMPYGIGMFNDDLEIIGKQYEVDSAKL